jgi:hypothetical protein
MANTNGFIHLPLPLKYVGRPKLHGGGQSDMRTKINLKNRDTHGPRLKQRAGELSRYWHTRSDERAQLGLPDIREGIPFLLEIDPTSDVEFLRGFGFEIICALADGFIVVASKDAEFETFIQKIENFIGNKPKSGSPAKIYALSNDNDRLSRIMSVGFKDIWVSLQDDTVYVVEFAVSCGGTVPLPDRPDHPERDANEDESEYNKRLAEHNQRLTNWQIKFNEAYQKWDEIASERQSAITAFVSVYSGEILTAFIEESDSFSFRLKINGKGLRDFVLNYPYIFYVSEVSDIQMESSSEQSVLQQDSLNIIAPDEASPIICIIDSGVQEGHKYIAPAIRSADSKSMIPDVTSVNDEVAGGGHGTRVAGAVLYPNGVPSNGDYQLPNFLRNIRVLDDTNGMPESVDPTSVIAEVASNFSGAATVAQSKIYNQSIAERKPYTDIAYMSSWAAQMDKQSYDKDILFIQAAGNISDDIIKAFIKAGHAYPEYLGSRHELSRLANPAQSLQALTVGSISASGFESEDVIAMGNIGEVASYSRIGPGIWDTIKPDVVEFGGTHAINKRGDNVHLTRPPEVCPELIRKSPPGKAFDRDDIGTSFAAPKVSFIAAEIEKILPNSPSLLYRALIAQSARWPGVTTLRTSRECEDTLRRIGFGLPNVDRATHNDDYRITLITSRLAEIGEKEAHVYTIKVPDELKAVGEDFDILLEVTLSYAANPRRTRRHIRGYLSTWVDWICSRKVESPDNFVRRVFDTGGSVDDSGNFNWMLGESRSRGQGQISDLSRSRGTLQKDWCIIKSNQLTDEFSIAVRGHNGWGSLFKAKYSLAVSLEAINQDIAIYEPIRLLNEVEIESNEIAIEVARGMASNTTEQST